MTKAKSSENLKFSIQEPRRTWSHRLVGMLFNGLIALLFFLALSVSLLEGFMPEVSVAVLLTVGSVACLVFVIILQSKMSLLGLLFALLWVFVFVLVLRSDMLNGLRLAANHMGEILGRRFGRIYPLYDVTVAESDYSLVATLFFVPVFTLLALLSSYVAHARDVLVSLHLGALFVFSHVFFKLELNVLRLALLFLAIFLVLAQVYDRRKDFYLASKSSYRRLALLAALLFVLVASLLFFALPLPEENPLAARGEKFIRDVDRFRFGLDAGLGLPDGDFTDLPDFAPSNETALEVTMAKPDSLWLRGYVGSTYSGSGWTPLESEVLYEYADTFYWLHADSFYGQKQLADAALVSAEESREKIFAMTIKNVGASSRNIYAPYELYAADDELLAPTGIGDAALKSDGWRGKREYSYYSLPNQVKRYPDLIQELYKDNNENMLSVEPFLLMESNYARYVYEQYTDIPESTEKWLDEYLADVLIQEEAASYAAIKQTIISYLTEETSYSAEPTSSGSGDFIYDFLLLDKTGYSPHYASAATIMFRYSGIPARYVEGYLLTPADVADSADNTAFLLDGTHAHAWVEVYQAGVGWIPVEVTPPYFGLMEEADSLEGVSGPDTVPEEAFAPEGDVSEEQPDRPDELKERFVASRGFQTFLLLSVLLLLAAFVIFLLRRYLRYRRWLKQNVADCTHANNTVAVITMFASAIEALQVLGQDVQGIWLLELLTSDVDTKTGLAASSLESAFYIYEEAAYSEQTVELAKRQTMQRFTSEIHQLLKERSAGLKRLKAFRFHRLFSKLEQVE